MRQSLRISTSVLLVVLFCATFALAAGLPGTKHDFSRDDPSNPFRESGKICTPCHRYVNSPPKATINGKEVQVKASRVCLACHSQATNESESKVNKKFIKDFTYHHPVDVPMPVDSGDFVPIKEAKAKGIVFYGEKNLIGCTSCHDTHNAKGYEYFLRDKMDQGQLCRDCHNK
ncbi:MAG: hypothetical protein H0Z38_08525 [Firmicutes bacterium]|nr:hypothetical protein [Bacillota bacterium]